MLAMIQIRRRLSLDGWRFILPPADSAPLGPIHQQPTMVRSWRYDFPDWGLTLQHEAGWLNKAGQTVALCHKVCLLTYRPISNSI